MKREKLKVPSDYKYEQYSFRVPERKIKLFNQTFKKIERLQSILNKNKSDDDKLLKRADIIIEALAIGVSEILKREKINNSSKT